MSSYCHVGFGDDKGNSRNEIRHYANDEIGVAVQSSL